MIIVADTSPLNYLILIGHIDILEPIYSEIVIPPAVQEEMLDPFAPPNVRAWMKDPPGWLQVRTPSHFRLMLDPRLDEGEREAIALAYEDRQSSVLLIDEQRGRREALRLGLKVAGTLGILETAAKRGLLGMRTAVEKLRETSFKASDALLNNFLNRA